jgi:hypothetical protein
LPGPLLVTVNFLNGGFSVSPSSPGIGLRASEDAPLTALAIEGHVPVAHFRRKRHGLARVKTQSPLTVGGPLWADSCPPNGRTGTARVDVKRTLQTAASDPQLGG